VVQFSYSSRYCPGLLACFLACLDGCSIPAATWSAARYEHTGWLIKQLGYSPILAPSTCLLPASGFRDLQGRPEGKS
jgi:hypothetical protein